MLKISPVGVLLSAHGLIPAFWRAETAVAQLFADRDWTLHVISCRGALRSHCVIKMFCHLDSNEVPDRVCNGCSRVSSRQLQVKHVLDSYPKQYLLEPSESEFSEEIAAYDVILKNHLSDISELDQFPDALKRARKSSHVAFQNGKRISEEIPLTHVFVTNAEYSIHQAFVQGVRSVIPDVKVCSIHSSGDPTSRSERVQISLSSRNSHRFTIRDHFKVDEAPSAPPDSLEMLASYFHRIYNSRFKTIHSKGLGSSKRDIPTREMTSGNNDVLIVMSSDDEVRAAESIGFTRRPIFGSHEQWINSLLQISRRLPFTRFRLRPHPRMWNSRSETASKYRSHFDLLLDSRVTNLILEDPNQVNTYESLIHCRAVLTSWSSMALEAAMVGLPVFTHNEEMQAWPTWVIQAAQSSDSYVQEVIDWLERSCWSFNQAVKAQRWAAWLWYGSTFPVVAMHSNPAFRARINNYLSGLASHNLTYLGPRLKEDYTFGVDDHRRLTRMLTDSSWNWKTEFESQINLNSAEEAESALVEQNLRYVANGISQYGMECSHLYQSIDSFLNLSD